MADEDELKTKRERKHETRTLGTEKLAKEAKAETKKQKAKVPEVVINPDATLPAVFEADLHEVAIELPEPEPYLEIPDGLPYSEWIAAAEQFKPLSGHLATGRAVIDRYDDSIMWRLGDFLNYGERMKDAGVEGYKEKYENALHPEDYGYSYDTLRRATWVAKKIAPRERFGGLSFKHHIIVAKLKEPSDRKRWLTRAQKENWSTSRLREEMNGNGPAAKAAKVAKAKTIEPLEFTVKDLDKSCETLYDLYEFMADLSKVMTKNPEVEVDYLEMNKRALAAADVVSAVLLGISEQSKSEEAA